MKNAPTEGKPLTLREQRNESIKTEYARMHREGLRSEVIFSRLSTRWALATDTIERIVFSRGYYRTATGDSTSASTAA